MLSVKELEFSYGDNKVLEEISFDANSNEIISILGKNGAGKTTLLKCLLKILKPQKGSIDINGKNIHGMNGRELSKHVAYVPQSYLPTMTTVFDSVLLGRKPYIELSAGKNDIDKTSQMIIDMGLASLSQKYVDRISGGEFQKVQIARALVQEPEILVLDEPTSNLDIANQHKTMCMIESNVRSRNVCALMTMHDINLAVLYSDRFIFMNNGRIEAFGGKEIISEDLIRNVYDMECEILDHHGVPFIMPTESSKYHKLKC